MDLVFVDLETTGGVAQRDRITEIAVVRYRDEAEVSRWSTLVNPEQTLTPFIQRLTGITDAMLATAPLFANVADEIRAQLEGAIFVAHNARFDYGFLKSEFRRLGQHWQSKNLCTVKLSRHIYPQFKKHGLDQLIKRHGLACDARHRALGDALATLMFYQHACDELGLEVIETAVNKLIQRPALPPNLPADELDSLPNSAGVYRFWGEEGALLYVGKSINIYQRVMSHFQDDHRLHKSQRLSQQLFHIDFTQTAGDLGAQLLELKEIKSLQPIHNRRSRAAKELKTVQLLENDDGYLKAHIVSSIDSSNLNQFFGIFKTVKEAEKAIKGLCQSYQLCPQLCGLEQGQGACFSRQLDKCKGACESLEAAVNYNVRAQLAFQGLKLKSWPWDGPIAIHEHDDFTNISASYVIWNWIHMTTVSNEQDLFEWVENNAHDSLEHVSFDKDCYQLLQRYLFSGKNKPQVTLLNVQ